MSNEQLLTLIASILVPLGSLILIQARATRRDMKEETMHLRENMKELRGKIGELRERVARLEGQFEQGSKFPRNPYSMTSAEDTPQAPDTGAEDVTISEANEGTRQ